MIVTMREFKEIVASVLSEAAHRYSHIYKANNRLWYAELSNNMSPKDADVYGPFATFDGAANYLTNTFNVSHWTSDALKGRPAPTMAPNGTPVKQPKRGIEYAGSRISTNDKLPREPRPRAAAPDVPSIASAADELPAAPVAKQPKGPKKTAYKIYGPHTGSPLHTRIAGTVYAPTSPSKFSKGMVANVEVNGDDLKVVNADDGHTQTWSRKEESFDRALSEFVKLVCERS